MSLRDIKSDDIKFDALEDSDTELDEFEVNTGNFAFTSDGDVFLPSDQWFHEVHGFRVYCDITGNEFNVFVSESEDDGSGTSLGTNFGSHFYEALLESCLKLNIIPADIKDAMSQVKPRLSKPTNFDHDAMCPYFGLIPVD